MTVVESVNGLPGPKVELPGLTSGGNLPSSVVLDSTLAIFPVAAATGVAATDTANITAALNAAIAATRGIVLLGYGTYAINASLPTINLPTVVLRGPGSTISTLAPTSAVSGDVLRVTMSPNTAVQQIATGGFTIDGTSAASGACGLHWGDTHGGIFDDLVIQNFNASGAVTPGTTNPSTETVSKGIWIDNTVATTGLTERLEWRAVRLNHNSVNIYMSSEGTATNSMDYQRLKHVMMSVNPGQVGLWMRNCLMQGGEVNLSGNISSNGSNNARWVYLDGNGSTPGQIIDSYFCVQCEQDGIAGTVYGLLADSGTTVSGGGLWDCSTAGGGGTITNSCSGIFNVGGWIQMPGIQSTSTPPSGWHFTSQSTAYTAFPFDLVNVTGSTTITLPAAPIAGQRVGVSRGGTVTVTVAGNTGQTINGAATVVMSSSSVVAESMLVFTALSSTQWRVESMANSDGGLGFFVGGTLNSQGGFGMNISAITGTTTVGSTASILNCSNTPYTVTFGTQLRAGQIVFVINTGTGNLTLACAGSGTINGESTITVTPGSSCVVEVITAGSTPVVYATGLPSPPSASAPSTVFARSGWTSESLDRRYCTSAAVTAVATGVIRMTAVYLQAGTVVSNLSFTTGTTAANTPTHSWLGLFDNNRNLLAVTADQTTTEIAASTTKTIAIANIASGAATSFITTYSGIYYVGISITASTVPTSTGQLAEADIVNVAPLLSGSSSTQNAPPSFPFQGSALSGLGSIAYVGTS